MKKSIEYQTYGGVFKARKKAWVYFLLPRISTTRKVEWEFTVDELSDPDTAPYDMIIGTDLLTELEIDFRFINQTIVWDDLTAPVQTGKNQDKDEIAYVLADEAPILKLAEERQKRILDASYAEIDLDEKVNAMESFSQYQKKLFDKTLKKFQCYSAEDWEQLTLRQFTWKSRKVQSLSIQSCTQSQKLLKSS